ncbi:WhiB family transcriptional regulator [Streptomyces sp. NBC_00233]|uniref:WhiB family transcriptional regulator n=1 Tax=Streptomyces sp. NBC_00233 TaxID=2975686 RepID=UPI00338D5B72
MKASFAHASWLTKAACAAPGIDPEVFFAPEQAARGWENEAKTICKSCPVTQECLEAAINQGVTDGVRGGMTGWERYLQGGPKPRRAKQPLWIRKHQSQKEE